MEIENRSVGEIALEMAEVAAYSEGDRESAHYKADQLLCEALKSISDSNIEKFMIRDLLISYSHVRKWYA